MEDFVTRLQTELDDLVHRWSSLQRFLIQGDHSALTEEHHALLVIQEGMQKALIRVLQRRMELLKK